MKKRKNVLVWFGSIILILFIAVLFFMERYHSNHVYAYSDSDHIKFDESVYQYSNVKCAKVIEKNQLITVEDVYLYHKNGLLQAIGESHITKANTLEQLTQLAIVMNSRISNGDGYFSSISIDKEKMNLVYERKIDFTNYRSGLKDLNWTYNQNVDEIIVELEKNSFVCFN